MVINNISILITQKKIIFRQPDYIRHITWLCKSNLRRMTQLVFDARERQVAANSTCQNKHELANKLLGCKRKQVLAKVIKTKPLLSFKCFTSIFFINSIWLASFCLSTAVMFNKNAKALKVHSVIYWSIYTNGHRIFCKKMYLKCTK